MKRCLTVKATLKTCRNMDRNVIMSLRNLKNPNCAPPPPPQSTVNFDQKINKQYKNTASCSSVEAHLKLSQSVHTYSSERVSQSNYTTNIVWMISFKF